jgi:hypothetical protein
LSVGARICRGSGSAAAEPVSIASAAPTTKALRAIHPLMTTSSVARVAAVDERAGSFCATLRGKGEWNSLGCAVGLRGTARAPIGEASPRTEFLP